MPLREEALVLYIKDKYTYLTHLSLYIYIYPTRSKAAYPPPRLVLNLLFFAVGVLEAWTRRLGGWVGRLGGWTGSLGGRTRRLGGLDWASWGRLGGVLGCLGVSWERLGVS